MQRKHVEILSRAASAMGADMLGKCSHATAATSIVVPVGDFRKIAELLQQLGDAMREVHGELDADGFRFWLPLPQIEAQRREVNRLRVDARAAQERKADAFEF